MGADSRLNPKIARLSDRQIAKICGVGNKFVGDVRAFPFSINDDGTFRVEDLQAGDYQLSVDAVDLQASSKDLEIGRVEAKFTIPEIQGGRSVEPFDLGTMVLKLK